MQIVRSIRADFDSLSGNFIVDEKVKTTGSVEDPIIRIFRFVRDKYKTDEIGLSIIQGRKTAIGWQYNILPTVKDGAVDVEETFQKHLEGDVGPEFEEKLGQFFKDPDGYVAYEICIKEGEEDAADQVVKDFIYRTASTAERKKLDRKSKKARKAELKALEKRKQNAETLKKLGLPAKLLATFF